MVGTVTRPLPAEVAALLLGVRARLWRDRFLQVAERVAWLALIVEAVAVAIHLSLTPLSVTTVPLLVLGAALAASVATMLNQPRPEDCARYADSALGGHSAYRATLEASDGRLTGSPLALDWLRTQTRGAAPIALAALSRAPMPAWPTASLVAAGTGAVALGLILSLPGTRPNPAPRPLTKTEAATSTSLAHPSAEHAPALDGLARQAGAASPDRAAGRGEGRPASDSTGDSGAAKGGAESAGAGAAGGREAGAGSDSTTRAALSQILELRSRRHALESGDARAGGTGVAAFAAAPNSVGGVAPMVAAPAARPSPRPRPELAGPVQSRLLARYATLREAEH